MRLTENRLRKIILEELGAHPALRETYSYSRKYMLLEKAYEALKAVQDYDYREAGMAPDPEVDEIIEALSGYMSAVEALANEVGT